jgi:serine protease Do
MKLRLLFPASSLALCLLVAGCHPDASHVLANKRIAQVPETATAAAVVAPKPAPFAAPPVLSGTLDVAALAAKVKPCVVNVTTVHASKDALFGEEGQKASRALGSGFIVDPKGLVVTNAHVVDGAKRVRVKLADDREFEAVVKGRDLRMDLALLQIQGANGDLPAVSLGSSDKLAVGEYVVAVGNPFGLGHTVTMGIVSAKGREIGAGPYDDFIQTDASINPGNSGGPLFDTRGEVIGINTAINPEAEGIGFAIPVDSLKDVLPQLIAKGRVDRGRLGVMVQGVDVALAKAMGLDGPKGALIEDVEKDGPASLAGLKPGDLIVAVGDRAIARSEELPRTIAKHEPGEKVSLKFLRDKQEHAIDVTLDAIKEKVDHSIDEDAADDHPSGKMGVAVADAPEGGALIRAVEPLSPADGELLPGDVVLTVEGKKIEDAKSLATAITAAPKGKALLLEVVRDNKKRWVGVDLK